MSDRLTIVGRIAAASNATYLARLAPPAGATGSPGTVEVVYKPIDGERPLWDFPDGTLAQREVAAYLVSETTGWGVVPRTWLGEGPLGPGMVQEWQDEDPAQHPVDVVPARRATSRPEPHRGPRPAVPDGARAGWRTVVRGEGAGGAPVDLVHEDTPALRRMAVLDVLINNADRKGAHVLPLADGRRLGVDHGVTFHVEPRLRTVLWGWVGEPLADDELAGVEAVRAALGGAGASAGAGVLAERLAGLLAAEEVRALAARCDRLLATARFPGPEGEMPALPWPLF